MNFRISGLVPALAVMLCAASFGWLVGASGVHASAQDQTATEPGQAASPLVAYAARIAGDRARTRIVMDFDREPQYAIHYLDNPQRIVVDLPATSFGFDQHALEPRGLYNEVRYGMLDENSARIVLTLARPAQIAIARVQEADEGKGLRLVLDAEMVKDEAFRDLVKAQSWGAVQPVVASRGDRIAAEPVPPAGSFIVAVDAGHGGIDAGASGATTNTPEKEITLAFAKDFAERLNRIAGIKAFLTRDKDEFLSLPERVEIARRQQANVFISFHADTLKQHNIRGATVYTLSDKASDRMAQDLAERENQSDIVAGADEPQKPAEVADILLDLTRRETQVFSIAAAEAVIKSFEGKVNLINNPHRYAGFRVLQAHDVPSILIELGFLSNKEDEQLLLDPKWRAQVCDLLADAVRRYSAPLIAGGG